MTTQSDKMAVCISLLEDLMTHIEQNWPAGKRADFMHDLERACITMNEQATDQEEAEMKDRWEGQVQS